MWLTSGLGTRLNNTFCNCQEKNQRLLWAEQFKVAVSPGVNHHTLLFELFFAGRC